MNTNLPKRPWSVRCDTESTSAVPGWFLYNADGKRVYMNDPVVLTYIQACVAACEGFEPAELTPRLLRRLIDQLTDEHNQSMVAHLLRTPG